MYRIPSQSAAGTSKPDGYLAIRYCLVIIGETLAHVRDEVLEHEQTIPWASIIGLRHRLVHAYWLIDPNIINDIARLEIEPLMASLDRLIEKLKA